MSSAAPSPVTVSGLASGLNTSQIIAALLEAEKRPLISLSNQQTRIEGQRAQLQSIQSSLQQLSFAAQELGLAALSSSQAVTSSNPAQVGASASSGAAVGGHEVEVSQLANSSQRTFTFKSPAAADKVVIDGEEFVVAAGASLSSLVSAINADANATVYAAATGPETLVLSTRTTGANGAGYIKVSDPGGTLVEQAALAKEGRNAEYKLDGVAGSSATNTLTNAIPGVTLTLKALTTVTGPVTVSVEPPAPETSKVVAQVQSFVSLYNATVTAVQHQLQTKPPAKPVTTAELQAGTLFGDPELMGVLNGMRASIYETQAGLPSGTASLAEIGVTTGAPSGTASVSQSAVEGELKVNVTTLERAIQSEPTTVEKLLQKWSTSFQQTLSGEALPGGGLEVRSTGDAEQASAIALRIAKMNEAIELHQQTLQQQFAAMEAAVSQSQSTSSWLASQLGSLSSGSTSSAKPTLGL
jgi:flagellar hook-associated protein 2